MFAGETLTHTCQNCMEGLKIRLNRWKDQQEKMQMKFLKGETSVGILTDLAFLILQNVARSLSGLQEIYELRSTILLAILN